MITFGHVVLHNLGHLAADPSVTVKTWLPFDYVVLHNLGHLAADPNITELAMLMNGGYCVWKIL